MRPADVLARALGHLDAFQGPPAAAWPCPDRGDYKEWQHFSVHGHGVDALINYNVASGGRGAREGHVTALVREGAWDGDVDAYAGEAVVLRRDRLDASFGRSALALRDGEYHLSVALADRPISLSLALRPETAPLLRYHVPFGPGASAHWLIIPRLRARGTIAIDGREHRLEGAPAYHDHNWGRFAWGGDFAWEWGYGLPACAANPWSVVFTRLGDRARTAVSMQALLLWKGGRQHRSLSGRDVEVIEEGRLRPRRIVKVPRVMALLAPEAATDVPRRLEVRAAAGSDHLRLRFEAEDLVQILVPNDRELGVTVLNEVKSSIRLDGVVGGERVEMEGHGMFEIVSA